MTPSASDAKPRTTPANRPSERNSPLKITPRALPADLWVLALIAGAIIMFLSHNLKVVVVVWLVLIVGGIVAAVHDGDAKPQFHAPRPVARSVARPAIARVPRPASPFGSSCRKQRAGSAGPGPHRHRDGVGAGRSSRSGGRAASRRQPTARARRGRRPEIAAAMRQEVIPAARHARDHR